jgi:hypothetical protein
MDKIDIFFSFFFFSFFCRLVEIFSSLSKFVDFGDFFFSKFGIGLIVQISVMVQN